MPRSFILMAILLTCCLAGCVSSRSILLHREESNRGWQTKRKLPGVPITLKVTTHLKVSVFEHHFRNNAATDTDSLFIEMAQPVRSVTVEPIKTKKIFTVDARRPGAGTLTANMRFADQYFDDITYNADDQTLEKVTGLVQQIAPGGLIGNPTSKNRSSSNIVEEETVVAIQLLELESPTFECDLKAFLDQHLSACHCCSGPTTFVESLTPRPSHNDASESDDDLPRPEHLPTPTREWP